MKWVLGWNTVFTDGMDPRKLIGESFSREHFPHAPTTNSNEDTFMT